MFSVPNPIVNLMRNFASPKKDPGYDFSNEVSVFPKDLFKKFLISSITLNSNDALGSKCEKLCLMSNKVGYDPLTFDCHLIYVNEETRTCYLGSFNYTYGPPGLSGFPGNDENEPVFDKNSIRVIGSNMKSQFGKYRAKI